LYLPSVPTLQRLYLIPRRGLSDANAFHSSVPPSGDVKSGNEQGALKKWYAETVFLAVPGSPSLRMIGKYPPPAPRVEREEGIIVRVERFCYQAFK